MSHDRNGQSFLALTFLIGVIVVGIGITLAFLATSSVESIYGYRAAVRAQTVALSGVQDALLQLDRNAAFSAAGGYTVAVGADTAAVTVTQNAGPPATATILSTATAGGSTEKAQAVVAVNATTSATTIQSISFVQ